VNKLKMDASAYLPDAKNDLSPLVNNKEVSPSDVRQILAIPGNSPFIAGPRGAGVEECVKT